MTAEATAAKTPPWAWAALLAVLGFNVWWRSHTFAPDVAEAVGFAPWPVVGEATEPLDCDEAAYAYIGRKIVAGAVLYRDLTENKPPLGYWLYALAVRVGGAHELTIRLMPIPAVLATIALVWWIGLRVSGPVAALGGACLVAVASTDPYLFGNGANLEHALNLFATAALAAMVLAPRGGGRPAIVAGGAALGGACLVKQVAITHLPLCVVALVVSARRGGIDRPVRARLADAVVLFVGFALPWCAAVAVVAARGGLAEAYDDVVRYGGALASLPADPRAPSGLIRWLTGNADPEGRLPWPFGSTDYLVWWGAGSWPLWMASAPCAWWVLCGGGGAGRRLVAAWYLSAWVQVVLPGLYWPHYYLLPVPSLALVVGIAASDAIRGTTRAIAARRLGRACVGGLAVMGLVAAIVGTVALQVRDYLLVTPNELTRRYKGGGQWIVLRALGRDIARKTEGWDDPHLFVWGIQSPLLFYSGLDSVTPHFFADNLIATRAGGDDPLIGPRIARIMHDLEAKPPDLIFAGYSPFPALRQFMRGRYDRSRLVVFGQPVSVPNGLGLWVRRDRFSAFERDRKGRGLNRR